MNNTTLPTRFHLGTQKAGSTFLYNLLSTHPDVCLASITEVHYYSKYFDNGPEWYDALFASEGVRIDTSPKYFMRGEEVAPRIKAACGENAKFLLILRNPIDLLNSHYQMQFVSGHFQHHSSYYPVVPSNVVDCVRQYADYRTQASYYSQLQTHWLTHFDQSQFKIVIFEEFIQNVDDTMEDILRFFELPAAQLTSEQTSKNRLLKYRWLFDLRSKIVRITWLKNALKRSRIFGYVYDRYLTEGSGSKITAEERSALASILQDEVTKLETLLGRDITAWKDFHPESS